MRTRTSQFLTVAGAIGAGATALVYRAYRKDLNASRQRIESGAQVIDSPSGPIEFAEAGDGPAVFCIHGAGGGFDQGLDLGRIFLGEGYRVIAPSRFGYLGTPLPDDASAEAQAEAHLRLLDELQLDRVPVMAMSGGAPSGMQLCLKHPERCSALVLLVPGAWSPDHKIGTAPSPLFEKVLNAIVESDFLFWAGTKAAHSALIRTILGTPVEVYRKAAPEVRRGVDELLLSILPISRRAGGLLNDADVVSHLGRYPLEDIRVPTLAISASDCLYGTYVSARYTAEHIPDARFIGFSSGGHLLLGHDEEIRSQVRSFIGGHLAGGKRTAAAS